MPSLRRILAGDGVVDSAVAFPGSVLHRLRSADALSDGLRTRLHDQCQRRGGGACESCSGPGNRDLAGNSEASPTGAKWLRSAAAAGTTLAYVWSWERFEGALTDGPAPTRAGDDDRLRPRAVSPPQARGREKKEQARRHPSLPAARQAIRAALAQPSHSVVSTAANPRP